MVFEDFFERATGLKPFAWQIALASSARWPAVVRIPTGMGKTAGAVLGWLWRRRMACPEIRAETPRRLVYCLPMRVLVEQTERAARNFISKLHERADLVEPPPVFTLIGGEDEGDWDERPERETVLVGTQDMLLSRALNRGYGMNHFRWPTQFGLLNSDCLWVVDEVQLFGPGLATTAQLQAFRRHFRTMLPARTLWMSATLNPLWLRTVDVNDEDLEGCVELEGRATGEARKRLEAKKAVAKARLSAYDTKALAEEVMSEHRPATRTLVVVNTVKRARALYDMLAKPVAPGKREKRHALPPPRLVLLHSRFRPKDRAARVDELLAEPGSAGTIIVSTQVVEAGVDVSCATLFTELAPWASLVQRFGRCNRTGEIEGARIFWIDVADKQARPYEERDLKEAREVMASLPDAGPARLPVGPERFEHTHVLRRKDLLELFDTTPDLAGRHADVSRFIRDADDTDILVFWRDFEEAPTKDDPEPARDEMCPVPIGELRTYLREKRMAWRWEPLDEDWVPLRERDLLPGLTLLLRASDGGYTSEVGWNPDSRERVPPIDLPPDQGRARERANASDELSEERDWKLLVDHVDEVVVCAMQIAQALSLAEDARTALLLGARWHDAGKAHEQFQKSLKRDWERKGLPRPPEGLLAKSALPKIRHERKGFRHELASGVLALMHGQPDIAAYLAASHHGKVRLALRSLPDEIPPANGARFARGIWEGDVVPLADLGGGVRVPETRLDLGYMDLGGTDTCGESWLARMLALRDEWGPFRLAFLEALLKAADERASGGGR